jgi:hypothetical protein
MEVIALCVVIALCMVAFCVVAFCVVIAFSREFQDFGRAKASRT